MKVEFYKHSISQKDIDNVVKVLNSLFLTTGEVVDEFEKKFAQYLGCKYTVGVTSCTGALHLSLLAYVFSVLGHLEAERSSVKDIYILW